MVLSRFWFTPRVWGSRIHAIHKATPQGPCFDHQLQDFAFQQKPWSMQLSMPHRQFMPCDWYLSIYNLWARTSQRRALSKRINSPPPTRCIFNRNQSTQNKIQCQTHNPFTSPFWVWTKPEALSSHIHLQVRLDDHQLFPSSWVYSPIRIVSNYPNDVKTSGLRPPSSSSTYRRIGYSEWV